MYYSFYDCIIVVPHDKICCIKHERLQANMLAHSDGSIVIVQYTGKTNRQLSVRIGEHELNLASNTADSWILQEVYNAIVKPGYAKLTWQELDMHCDNWAESVQLEQANYERLYNLSTKPVVANIMPPAAWPGVNLDDAIALDSMHRKMSMSSRRRWSRPEEYQKMSIATKAGMAKPEVRKKISDGVAASFADGMHARNIGIAASRRYRFLHKYTTMHVYHYKFAVGRFQPWMNFIIQTDGNVIVFQWDTRFVLFQCSIDDLPAGYAKTHDSRYDLIFEHD